MKQSNIEVWSDWEGIHFRGMIAKEDYIELPFSKFDRLVIAECSKPDATGADWLLALELIFRVAELEHKNDPGGDARPAATLD